MNNLSPQERMLALASSIDERGLSSLKRNVMEIFRLFNQSDVSIKKLQDIIAVDPPLTGRILKTANSAFYGSQRKIGELSQAIVWLGMDVIKEIALSQKISELYMKSDKVGGFSRTALWEHCQAVAMAAKLIYRREFRRKGDDIYASGLLHDIGIIILDQYMPDEFALVIDRIGDYHNDQFKAENALLGFNHAQLGQVLTEKWGFPPELVANVANHHHPQDAPQDYLISSSVLFLADSLTNKMDLGFNDSSTDDAEERAWALEKLGISEKGLEFIAEEMVTQLAKMRETSS